MAGSKPYGMDLQIIEKSVKCFEQVRICATSPRIKAQLCTYVI
jgi:hypothetical protein